MPGRQVVLRFDGQFEKKTVPGRANRLEANTQSTPPPETRDARHMPLFVAIGAHLCHAVRAHGQMTLHPTRPSPARTRDGTARPGRELGARSIS